MKLLVTGAYNLKISERTELEELGFEVTFVQNEQESLGIDVSQFETVICNSLFQFNNIKDFNKLKYIHVTSAGLDRLPMEYINNNNIKVFNARGVYSQPMAEWVILMILNIYKDSKYFIKNQRNKLWEKKRNIYELTDKVVSIIGFGSVGQEIAKKLSAFDSKIIAVDNKEDISNKYISCYQHTDNLENILQISDIVIITLPLTESTFEMFDYHLMSNMKDCSVLINISRGQIINENDLIKLLEEDKFLGCGLDVFETEPLPKENKLWEFENVYISPHNSFVSNKNKSRLYGAIKSNLREVIN